jgi:hypothetical protein
VIKDFEEERQRDSSLQNLQKEPVLLSLNLSTTGLLLDFGSAEL